MSTEPRTPAWIEVRGDSLRRNLRRIRETVGPGAPLIPMVKAEAYGLGMRQAVRALAPENPWGWGVATVDEGIELRGLEPERPILVIVPAPPGGVAEGIAHRLTFGVSDLAFLEVLAREARRQEAVVPFHLEIDTGIGRAGFDWRAVDEWGPRVRELAGGAVRCSGAFTHFHSADVKGGDSIGVQAARFHDAVASLGLEGEGLLFHLCNSAGALRRPDLAAGGVRAGIYLYGGEAGEGLPSPVPAVSVRARIGLVREVPPGTTVGYGATHVARRWERWATVGIGYADGLRRALSNRGHALVKGRRAPIVGRISMDMTVVDITDIPDVEPGGVATFLGVDGRERITLEEIARHVGTIGYEVLTGLGPRLPRIWVEGGVRPEGDGRPDESGGG